MVLGSPRIPSCQDGASEGPAPSTVPALGGDIPGTSATPRGWELCPLGWAGMGWDVSMRDRIRKDGPRSDGWSS